LRRIVDKVWVLIVKAKGKYRMAAVQIWFAGGKRHRDYLIVHRPARGNASGKYPAGRCALSFAGVALADDLDLRDPADARRLEKVLLEMDTTRLAQE
jgi:hypothetical protein